MATRKVGSSRPKEGGFSAVHKQDFNAHVTGGDWFHDASHIKMNPLLTTFSQADVQAVLSEIDSYLSSGIGTFLSIGNSTVRGDITVGDPGVADLEAAFVLALADPRISGGGTIVIKSGTYDVSDTIVVPPGINVIGDLAGTIINKLDNGALNQYTFRVTPSIGYYSLGTYPDAQQNIEPIDVTKFFNLILADRLGTVGNIALDGYAAAFILCDPGSHVYVDRVSFVGKSADSYPYKASNRAILCDGASSSNSTILQVTNSYFDGVKCAIEFLPNQGALDFLRVENCRARTFGDAAGSDNDNAFITSNMCNIHVVNNYHKGLRYDDYYAGYFVLINNEAISGRPGVIITGNTGGVFSDSGTHQVVKSNIFVDNRSTPSLFNGTIVNNNWGGPDIQVSTPWELTCGNGTTSFGDFNGNDSLRDALNYLEKMVTDGIMTDINARILVKAGTYNPTDTPFSGISSSVTNLVIEGEGDATYFVISHNWYLTASSATLKNIKFFNTGLYRSITFNSGNVNITNVTQQDILFSVNSGNKVVLDGNDFFHVSNLLGGVISITMASGQENSSISIVNNKIRTTSGKAGIILSTLSSSCTIGSVDIRNNTFEMAGNTGTVLSTNQGGPVRLYAPSAGTTYGDFSITKFAFSDNSVRTINDGGQCLFHLRAGTDAANLQNQWKIVLAEVSGNVFTANYGSAATTVPIIISGTRLFPTSEQQNGIETLIFNNNVIRAIRSFTGFYAGIPTDYSVTFDVSTEPGMLFLQARELSVENLKVSGFVLEDGQSDIGFNGVVSCNINKLNVEYISGNWYISGVGSYPLVRVGIWNPQGIASNSYNSVRVENCEFISSVNQLIANVSGNYGLLGFLNLPGVATGSGHVARYYVRGNHFCNTIAGNVYPAQHFISVINKSEHEYHIESNRFRGCSLDGYAINAEFSTKHPKIEIVNNSFDSASVRLEWSYNTADASFPFAFMRFNGNSMVKGSLSGSSTADHLLNIRQSDGAVSFVEVCNNSIMKELNDSSGIYCVYWGRASENTPRGIFMGNQLTYAVSTPTQAGLKLLTSATVVIRGLELVNATTLNNGGFAVSSGTMAFNTGLLVP